MSISFCFLYFPPLSSTQGQRRYLKTTLISFTFKQVLFFKPLLVGCQWTRSLVSSGPSRDYLMRCIAILWPGWTERACGTLTKKGIRKDKKWKVFGTRPQEVSYWIEEYWYVLFLSQHICIRTQKLHKTLFLKDIIKFNFVCNKQNCNGNMPSPTHDQSILNIM